MIKLNFWIEFTFTLSPRLFMLHVLRSAETLLPGSRFHRYIRDGRSQIRSSAPYSVPDDVHQHLDFGSYLF